METAVSAASESSFATPVVGVVNDGTLVMTMGTSLCHILVSRKEVHMKGISGVVKDGVIPGYYGYEAGQAAVGDIYDWFIQTLAPSDSFDEAAEENTSPFAAARQSSSPAKTVCSLSTGGTATARCSITRTSLAFWSA